MSATFRRAVLAVALLAVTGVTLSACVYDPYYRRHDGYRDGYHDRDGYRDRDYRR